MTETQEPVKGKAGMMCDPKMRRALREGQSCSECGHTLRAGPYDGRVGAAPPLVGHGKGCGRKGQADGSFT